MHSRYARTLADAVIEQLADDDAVQRRRRFFENPDCAAGTFAEQVPDLRSATPAGPCAAARRGDLDRAGTGKSRPGALWRPPLGMTMSRSSLLRLIRGLPDPPVPGGRACSRERCRVPAATSTRHDALVDMIDRHPVDLLTDHRGGHVRRVAQGASRHRGDLPGIGQPAYALGRPGRRTRRDPGRRPMEPPVAQPWLQPRKKCGRAPGACLRDPTPDAQDRGAGDRWIHHHRSHRCRSSCSRGGLTARTRETLHGRAIRPPASERRGRSAPSPATTPDPRAHGVVSPAPRASTNCWPRPAPAACCSTRQGRSLQPGGCPSR